MPIGSVPFSQATYLSTRSSRIWSKNSTPGEHLARGGAHLERLECRPVQPVEGLGRRTGQYGSRVNRHGPPAVQMSVPASGRLVVVISSPPSDQQRQRHRSVRGHDDRTDRMVDADRRTQYLARRAGSLSPRDKRHRLQGRVEVSAEDRLRGGGVLHEESGAGVVVMVGPRDAGPGLFARGAGVRVGIDAIGDIAVRPGCVGRTRTPRGPRRSAGSPSSAGSGCSPPDPASCRARSKAASRVGPEPVPRLTRMTRLRVRSVGPERLRVRCRGVHDAVGGVATSASSSDRPPDWAIHRRPL